jgi:hypothetical protein
MLEDYPANPADFNGSESPDCEEQLLGDWAGTARRANAGKPLASNGRTEERHKQNNAP